MKKIIVILALFVALIYVLETQDVTFYNNLKTSVSDGWNTLIQNDDPIFSGDDEITVTDITPITLAAVKATLTAKDLTDGDLTSSIVVISDTYTGNESILGEHDIVFSVSDVEGNITTFTVTVVVVDDTVTES